MDDALPSGMYTFVFGLLDKVKVQVPGSQSLEGFLHKSRMSSEVKKSAGGPDEITIHSKRKLSIHRSRSISVSRLPRHISGCLSR